MKIISLNVWNGCISGIMDDIIRLAADDDLAVICLQEIHHAGSPDITKYLMPSDPGARPAPMNTHFLLELHAKLADSFNIHYSPQLNGLVHDCEVSEYPALQYGNVVMVRRTYTYHYRDGHIAGHDQKMYCFETRTPAGKTAQAVDLDWGGHRLTVGHAHGAWDQGHKGDNAWRVQQADEILRLLDPGNAWQWPSYTPQVVLVGDLYVRSDTEMVRHIIRSPVFGPHGAEHLNHTAGVTDTRTAWYKKAGREADHAFASPGLRASLTLDDTVHSDHAALIVTIHP